MSGHTSSPDDTYCFFASDAITGAGACQLLRDTKVGSSDGGAFAEGDESDGDCDPVTRANIGMTNLGRSETSEANTKITKGP